MTEKEDRENAIENSYKIKSTDLTSLDNSLDLDQQTEEVRSDPKWLDNKGDEVEKVFGFNKNAELVNARAAMFGFAMLVITELIFKGEAATHAIFGIN